MPRTERRLWRHEYAHTTISQAAATNTSALLTLTGSSNEIRSIKELRARVQLQTNGLYSGMIGWYMSQENVQLSEVDFADTRRFWRPVPVTGNGSATTPVYTLRWPRVILSEDDQLRLVVRRVIQGTQSTANLVVSAHWLEHLEQSQN